MKENIEKETLEYCNKNENLEVLYVIESVKTMKKLKNLILSSIII